MEPGVSAVPAGLDRPHAWAPTFETLGYSQASLRDDDEGAVTLGVSRRKTKRNWGGVGRGLQRFQRFAPAGPRTKPL